MKTHAYVVVALFGCQASAAPTPPAKRVDHRPTLVVLGTYHMANDGDGFLNVKSHDVMDPKRQREIERLVGSIERYRPTKVALEKPVGDAETTAHYRDYIAGTYALGRNEVDQVGFRIAKAMHLPAVHPFDWRNHFDLQPVMAFAAMNGQSEILMAGIGEARRFLGELETRMASVSVDELYRYLNEPAQAPELHRIYMTLLRIGKGESYAGADVLAQWYERNLKMVTNLIRIAEPDDRILVLVGSGHIHLLQQLAAESGVFVIEPALPYLQ